MALRLTVRADARVKKERHDDLAAALRSLRAHVNELTERAPSAASGGRLMRRFEPVQQVVGRVEIKGHGGVDVRGDGSAEAFTGRLSRTLVEQRDGESATDALARALGV